MPRVREIHIDVEPGDETLWLIFHRGDVRSAVYLGAWDGSYWQVHQSANYLGPDKSYIAMPEGVDRDGRS